MTTVILLALFCSGSARAEAFLDVFGGAGITLRVPSQVTSTP